MGVLGFHGVSACIARQTLRFHGGAHSFCLLRRSYGFPCRHQKMLTPTTAQLVQPDLPAAGMPMPTGIGVILRHDHEVLILAQDDVIAARAAVVLVPRHLTDVEARVLEIDRRVGRPPTDRLGALLRPPVSARHQALAFRPARNGAT